MTQDVVEWYTGIRGAKLYHMQIAFPTTPVEDLVPFLTRDFSIEGWLWKTGPRVGDAYKKRWFILDDRKLMYLEHPLVSQSFHQAFGSSDLIFHSLLCRMLIRREKF